MAIHGFVEQVGTFEVRGWAFDDEEPSRHLTMEIFIGDRLVGRAEANVYRRDLELGQIGDGDHCFIFNFYPTITAEASRAVSVVAQGKGQAEAVLSHLHKPRDLSANDAAEVKLEFPEASIDEDQRPIFILGSARSGTSAVAQALTTATHYVGNEEGHFFDFLAPMMVKLEEFYIKKSDESESAVNTSISRIPKSYVVDGLKHLALTASRQLFQSGAWIDKTPTSDMIYLAPILKAIWPNASFIFMRRRGIENVASRIRKFKYDFAHNCREWVASMAAWQVVRAELGSSAIELDQFLLSRRPDLAGKAIATLVRLSDQEEVRLGNVLASARPQRTDGRIAEALSLDSLDWDSQLLEIFKETCGPMMMAYGYTYGASYSSEAVEMKLV